MPDELATTMLNIADPSGRPALSATTDMPQIAAPEPVAETPPVVEPKPADPAPPVADPAAAPTPEAKPDNGISRRFSELSQQRREAEAREARLAARLEQALDVIETLKPKPEPPPVEPKPSRPSRLNYDDPVAFDAAMDQYEEALVEWSSKRSTAIARTEEAVHAEEQRKADEAKKAEAARTEAQNAEVAAWNERQAKAAEKYADYHEVVSNDALPITMPMAEAILRSDVGTDVAYYLGTHVDEAARIAAMNVPNTVFPPGHQFAGQPVPDVARQMIEIGKIAARLSIDSMAPPPPELPAPPSPLRTSPNSVGASTREPSMEEYAASRMPKLQSERRPSTWGRA